METPWPKKGMKLFKQGPNYYEFAHIGWGDISFQYQGYIKGYKIAADNLVDYAVSTKRNAILDTCAFPIIFLYRQYLELSMKDIYISYSNDTPETKVKKLDKISHNLVKIWNKIKPIIKDGLKADDKYETLEAVEDYINQFQTMDRYSFNFRYPVDKNLKLNFKNEERISLTNLKNRMTELEYFFTGVDGQLSYIQDARQEYYDYIHQL